MHAYADRHDFVQTGEALGAMLPSWVNVAYYQSLMGGIREAIAAGELEAFAARCREGWARGDLESV